MISLYTFYVKFRIITLENYGFHGFLVFKNQNKINQDKINDQKYEHALYDLK